MGFEILISLFDAPTVPIASDHSLPFPHSHLQIRSALRLETKCEIERKEEMRNRIELFVVVALVVVAGTDTVVVGNDLIEFVADVVLMLYGFLIEVYCRRLFFLIGPVCLLVFRLPPLWPPLLRLLFPFCPLLSTPPQSWFPPNPVHHPHHLHQQLLHLQLLQQQLLQL